MSTKNLMSDIQVSLGFLELSAHEIEVEVENDG